MPRFLRFTTLALVMLFPLTAVHSQETSDPHAIVVWYADGGGFFTNFQGTNMSRTGSLAVGRLPHVVSLRADSNIPLFELMFSCVLSNSSPECKQGPAMTGSVGLYYGYKRECLLTSIGITRTAKRYATSHEAIFEEAGLGLATECFTTGWRHLGIGVGAQANINAKESYLILNLAVYLGWLR